jgi:hypothetical protein
MAAIAGQRHGEHVSAATNKHATIEEFLEQVFPMKSVPRLYDKDQLDKQAS